MTTQVPAVSAIVFGQASDSSVRRIGPSTSAFRTGGSGGGSGRSASSAGISAMPTSDISAPCAWPAKVYAVWRSGHAPILIQERDRTQNRHPLLLIALRTRISCRVRVRRSTAKVDSHRAKRIGGLRDCRVLPNRPDERRFAAFGGPQMNRYEPPAAGGEPLQQALQHLCAGGTVVGDIGHQLPALLLHLEAA